MTCPARRFARDHAVPRRQEQDLEGKVLRFLMRGDGGSRRPAELAWLQAPFPEARVRRVYFVPEKKKHVKDE